MSEKVFIFTVDFTQGRSQFLNTFKSDNQPIQPFKCPVYCGFLCVYNLTILNPQ